MVVEIVIVIAIVVTANNDQGIHQDNLRELNVTTRRLIDEARAGNTLVVILAD